MGIRLSDERYEEIKQIVVRMYEEYDISCVPINGFEIASKMDIKVVPYSAYPEATQRLLLKKSDDGFCLQLDTGEWYIYYNDKKGYGRINNTIMHEIGHVVLDHTEDSELAEKEVKFFAKFALAPPVLVHKLKLESPEEIADIFEISYEAASNALSYYHKWLRYGDSEYTDYEEKILYLFSQAS